LQGMLNGPRSAPANCLFCSRLFVSRYS